MLNTIFEVFTSETGRQRRKYLSIKQMVYETILAEICPYIGPSLTDLTEINWSAIRAWESQWRPSMPQGKIWSDWDWRTDTRAWKRHVDCFEVAVWSGNQLCGLGVGKPSANRNNMSVYLLQGSPVANHPLSGKILAIVLDVAAAYGTALGCRELRLVRPLSGMVGKYQSLGFRLVSSSGSAPYCVRRL